MSDIRCNGFRGIISKDILQYNAIVGWDLGVEISRPLFTLCGHENVISTVIAVGCKSRCMSIDESGELRLWDISRVHPGEKTEAYKENYFT
jgi:hypothetical protein